MRGSFALGKLAAVVAAAAGFLAVAPYGDAAPSQPEDDGGVAPADCWTAVGGCPSRSAAAATRPVLGPVATAWEQTVKGEIECEPLVWGRTVFVATRDNAQDDVHSMTAISLSSGKVLGRKTWRGTGPLLPSVWNGSVVVRSAPHKFDVVRLRDDGFAPVSSVDVGARVEDVLFFRREIYVRAEGRILRYDLGRKAPTWTVGGRFRGRLALRGTCVYAVGYAESGGNASLSVLSRDGGEQLGKSEIGHHGGAIPDPLDDAPRVQVLADRVFVHHAMPVKTSDGAGANLAILRRSVVFDRPLIEEAGLFDGRGEVAACAPGWLGSAQNGDGGPELWWASPDDRHWVLATKDRMPQLAEPAVPPSGCGGGFAYLGACAVEPATRRIAWTATQTPLFRVVPAHDAALVALRGGKLVALRTPRPADAPAKLFGASEAVVQGRVVCRDGSLIVGGLRLRPGGPLVVEGTPPRTIPLEEVLFAEDAAGVVLAASKDGARDAVELLANRDVAQAYAALAARSSATRDPALMERLLAEASTRGADAKDCARVESQIKDLTSRTKPPAVDDAATARILAEEKDALATPSRSAWERCRRLAPDAPRSLVLDLLEVALAGAPSHPDAAARVRSMLPAGVTPTEPFDARDWISFLRVLDVAPVAILPPPTPGDPDLTPGARLYGMYLTTWRRDLVAVKSGRLLIVSAPTKPGRIANCLSAGELLCDAMDTAFAAGKHVRDKAWPMTILLFENRDEYLRVLGKGKQTQEEMRMLEWSIGQYSAGDGARLYLPEDDDGFRQVLHTFQHELTHQWLAERCPLYSAADGGRGGAPRGHFVVEGFATMVEEFRFDLARRTWGFDPAAESLDTVAGLKSGALFPWKDFFVLTHDDFHRLDHENDLEVRSRRTLRGTTKMSKGHVFYAQGAAVCHYLWQAEGGKLRQALLDYTAAYYAGKPPTVQDAFGMSEEDLGRRVVAFAQAPEGR
jgi:hypothetical protein